MKIIEIKGLWGILGLLVFVALAVLMLVGIPSLLVWITWNALIGELCHGPMLSFVQAMLLSAIFFVLGQILFQPKWYFEFQKNDPPKSKHD